MASPLSLAEGDGKRGTSIAGVFILGLPVIKISLQVKEREIERKREKRERDINNSISLSYLNLGIPSVTFISPLPAK